MTIPKLESGELHRYKLTEENSWSSIVFRNGKSGNAEEEKVDKLQNV